MVDLIKKSLAGQFEAALCMLNQCIQQCPTEHWDGKIANDTFRQISYHTLFWTDYHLSTSESAFTVRELHQRGGDEWLPTPSAGLERDETLDYLAICRQKAIDTIASETIASLEGPTGFARLQFTRFELYVHNIRHVQHHTGQLSAYLRRLGLGANWVRSGWQQL